MEQTYIMIKPDGVQRGLVGKIIQRFEEKGFFLRGMKMMQVEKAHAEKHYADLSSKPFFAVSSSRRGCHWPGTANHRSVIRLGLMPQPSPGTR